VNRKKEKPSANRRSKVPGKFTNAKPAFSHGDPVNRKASRIRAFNPAFKIDPKETETAAHVPAVPERKA